MTSAIGPGLGFSGSRLASIYKFCLHYTKKDESNHAQQMAISLTVPFVGLSCFRAPFVDVREPRGGLF
jgi:hypothetical protein